MLSNTLIALTLAAAGASTFASPVPIARDFGATNHGTVQLSTFQGQTACGEDYTNGYHDSPEGFLLIGVDGDTFGDGSICGQQIRIGKDEKFVMGVVVDSCGDGCGDKGLLATPEIFAELAQNQEAGSFEATWATFGTPPSRRDDGETYTGLATKVFVNDPDAKTACGGTWDNDANLVALDSALFGDGSVCGKEISITAPNARTLTAIVSDICTDAKCVNVGDITMSWKLRNDMYGQDAPDPIVSWRYVTS